MLIYLLFGSVRGKKATFHNFFQTRVYIVRVNCLRIRIESVTNSVWNKQCFMFDLIWLIENDYRTARTTHIQRMWQKKRPNGSFVPFIKRKGVHVFFLADEINKNLSTRIEKLVQANANNNK